MKISLFLSTITALALCSGTSALPTQGENSSERISEGFSLIIFSGGATAIRLRDADPAASYKRDAIVEPDPAASYRRAAAAVAEADPNASYRREADAEADPNASY